MEQKLHVYHEIDRVVDRLLWLGLNDTYGMCTLEVVLMEVTEELVRNEQCGITSKRDFNCSSFFSFSSQKQKEWKKKFN